MKYCAATTCSNNSKRTPELRFYEFPKDPDIRAKWEAFSKPGHGTRRYLCREHFDPGHWRPVDVRMNLPLNDRRLVDHAVPTMNPGTDLLPLHHIYISASEPDPLCVDFEASPLSIPLRTTNAASTVSADGLAQMERKIAKYEANLKEERVAKLELMEKVQVLKLKLSASEKDRRELKEKAMVLQSKLTKVVAEYERHSLKQEKKIELLETTQTTQRMYLSSQNAIQNEQKSAIAVLKQDLKMNSVLHETQTKRLKYELKKERALKKSFAAQLKDAQSFQDQLCEWFGEGVVKRMKRGKRSNWKDHDVQHHKT